MVGIPRSVLRQLLHREAWSDFTQLRNGRPRLCLLPAPGIRRGEISPGAPERLPGRRRLQAPFDGLRITRQVRVRVAQDVVPDEQVRIARTAARMAASWRFIEAPSPMTCPRARIGEPSVSVAYRPADREAGCRCREARNSEVSYCDSVRIGRDWLSERLVEIGDRMP